jgi:hypothetical protein
MRPLKLSLILLVLTAWMASSAAPDASASGFPRHKCGSFIDEQVFSSGEVFYTRVTVFNGNHLSCRTATNVIKAFWGPEGTIKSHGGPAEAQRYYTIEGWPGWRCYTGAGGGSCIRHGRIAAYLSRSA